MEQRPNGLQSLTFDLGLYSTYFNSCLTRETENETWQSSGELIMLYKPTQLLFF